MARQWPETIISDADRDPAPWLCQPTSAWPLLTGAEDACATDGSGLAGAGGLQTSGDDALTWAEVKESRHLGTHW
jgi:hypothetical protein